MRRSSLALIVLLLALAGCGGAGSPSVSVLHRGTGEEPESLDYHKSSSTEAGHVQRDLGEGLVGYAPDGELVPAAASSWESSPDGTEYLFELRPEARWSNGDPVTAEDFVYSYRRAVDPRTAAVYIQSVDGIVNAKAILEGRMPPASLGVEAVGKHRLRIRLAEPIPYFLGLLAHPSMFPVHRASIEEYGDDHTRPGKLVTNGAYRLRSRETGAYIELERNPYYWNNDATAIDIVRHFVTPEPMAELNRYRAGELDTTRTIPPQAFAKMQRERPNEVRVSPALGVYFYGFNLTRPPFAGNPRLREALSLAIDRETIVELVGRGEKPAYSFVPPGTANYSPSAYAWADQSQAERNKRAVQLFHEAGFGDNVPLQVEIRYNTQETHRQIAEAIQSMWRTTLGIEVTLVNEEFQVLLANITARQVTQVFRANWNGDYNDANTFLEILESNNPSNYEGYTSPDYDELMQRASRETDPVRRRVIMERAEREMLDDYPLIPIYFYVNKSMVSPRVRGWGDNVLNYHYSQHLSLAADDDTRSP